MDEQHEQRVEKEREREAERRRIMHLCITMMSSGTFARKETSLIAERGKRIPLG